MKKLLFTLLFIVPFALSAQDPQPDPCGVGGCTDTLNYTIKNDQGAVVDQTTYDRDVGLPYVEAMALKYVRLLRCTDKEINTLLDVLKAGGDPSTAIMQLLEADVNR